MTSVETLPERTKLPVGNLEKIGEIMRERIEKFKSGRGKEMDLVKVIRKDGDYSFVRLGDVRFGSVEDYWVVTEELNSLRREILEEECGERCEQALGEYEEKDDEGNPLVDDKGRPFFLEVMTYYASEKDIFFIERGTLPNKVEGNPVFKNLTVGREGKSTGDKAKEARDAVKEAKEVITGKVSDWVGYDKIAS